MWSVEFTKQAEKQFNKLDHSVQKRIVDFLNNRLRLLDNPKQLGKPLQGTLSEEFHYP